MKAIYIHTSLTRLQAFCFEEWLEDFGWKIIDPTESELKGLNLS
jgi:hypothetical protein